jgi:hypothetical protein
MESETGNRARHAVVANDQGRVGRRDTVARRLLPGLWDKSRDGPTHRARHPLASVGMVVLGLRCSWCPGSAPMPKLLGM